MSRTAAFGESRAQTSQKDWPDWFDHDPRWLLAQRVASSQAFARSRFLSRFLLYIVAETLEERTAEISEHQIGVQVFDRSPGYRSTEDNIVRTYARQLRRRLAEYFATEGAAETLHVDVPIGAYLPVFQPAPIEPAPSGLGTSHDSIAALPTIITIDPPAIEKPTPRRRWHTAVLLAASIALYSVILLWLASLFWTRVGSNRIATASNGPTAPLWTALFGGPANCYIVPADAGFNLIEDVAHRSLPLAVYVNGGYLTQPLPPMDDHSVNDLRGQRFTSFVDLETVTALAGLPEFNPHNVILRFPRDLELDDLKNSNAIILGSMSSNPWASIAESNANFRIVNGPTMQDATITNLNPQPGEQSTYASQWNQPAHETYAVIAFLPNLSANGHLLLVEGLDVAGTQAAAEMLFHPAAISSVLQRATRSDGTLRSFEVLLRSSSIGSRSTKAEVIGIRIY
jgi:hypothetical protein